MSVQDNNPTLSVWIEGVGTWTPELADWPAMRDWLRGADLPPEGAAGKPRPQILPAGERRRAPLSVLVAIEVAGQAIAMSGSEPGQIPSLFACAHGDADILDYTCATLAEAPAEISPTRFHNSVHNAAAGYWTIATGCHAASSALTALDYTFGASLLEAASLAHAESTRVLLVASDGPGCGPLREVIASQRRFGCALMLAPEPADGAIARLDICLADHQPDEPPSLRAQELAEGNLSARGSKLLELLANGVSSTLRVQAAPQLDLDMTLEYLT